MTSHHSNRLDDYKMGIICHTHLSNSNLSLPHVISEDVEQYAQLASRALLQSNKQRGIRKAIPRHLVLRAASNLIEKFRPRTEYHTPESIPNLRLSKSCTAKCENPACNRLARGGVGGPLVHCARCSMSAYCSRACCDADAKYHSQVMCLGTVNYEIRRIVPALARHVHRYYRQVAYAIPDLKFNEWISPIYPCATSFRTQSNRLGEIGDWLKYRIAHKYLTTCVLNGPKHSTLPCMVCERAIEFPGLCDVIWDVSDIFKSTADDNDDEEEEEEVVDCAPSPKTERHGTLERRLAQRTTLEITGISRHGAIRAIFNVFCSRECTHKYDFVRDSFVDVLFFADPLSGNPIVDITLNCATHLLSNNQSPSSLQERLRMT